MPDPERLIDAVVAAGNAALPGRVAAWYVVGSHADGTAIEGSDLDVVAVLEGDVTPDEDRTLRRSRHGLGEPHHIFVDLSTLGTSTLLARGNVAIGGRSRLVHGRDLRPQLAPTDLADYRRQVMHLPFALCTRIRGTTVIECPLGPPDGDLPFLGYEVCRFLPEDHHDRHTLKDMVAIGTFIATALAAPHVSRPLTSKSEALAAYRALEVGPWSGLLEFLVETVRARWHWRVPSARGDRDRLLEACHALLSFENEFFDAYARFLAQELARPRPARDEWLEERVRSLRRRGDSGLGRSG